ncbi:uncharacterized protein LOC131669397 [Phymastichus coffea]|uniref:uncharacterized protein LOC131669397 n=1 Tax=Phymastichus coffea TaxID=108790 RepID=UPI00273B7840|nr:uncharacterized protein LOC131669397 [Phymastichus coffea]
MFSPRRIISFGLRMTLQHLQENITSMQSIQKPALFMQRCNFSIARTFMSEFIQKPTVENTSSDENLKQQLAEITGKLQLSFTCKKCNTRNFNKFISKHAYNKGVVIVRCDGCKNNHLIADNLGWFGNQGNRNIESIMKKKGETVRRIKADDHGGYFEVLATEEALRIETLLKKQITENIKPVEETEEVDKVKYEKVR